MENFIQFNKKEGYITKWELAYYCGKEDDCPDRIFEFDLKEKEDAQFDIGATIFLDDYEKIEIALVGQTEDGANETYFNFKTIFVENDNINIIKE